MSDPWRPPDPANPWAPPPARRVPPAPAAWFRPAGAAPEDERVDFDVVAWLRDSTLALLAPFAGALLLAAPVGLAWVRLTPRIPLVETPQGLELEAAEGAAFFGAEGWFALLCAAAGLATGVVAWRALRGRGPGVPLGLAAGGLLGAQVAQEVGGRVVVDDRMRRLCAGSRELVCQIYDGRLHVRAGASFLVWALTAVVAYLALVVAFDRERHDRGPLPDQRAGGSPR